MTVVFSKLGDVSEFINGAAFKPEDWGEVGNQIIRIQNLTNKSKPYNRTNRKISERLHVQPGDLLVSWSATLGVFEWEGPEVGLLNQHIFRVLPNTLKVDKRYLRYALELALLDMHKHMHGATMLHVNRGEFLSTKLYLPSLSEQRRIAAILDQADELRTKRREALAQLDSLAQSIFIEMFGDPAQNPRGWVRQQLIELCDAPNDIKCGPFGTQLAKSEFTTEGVPLWGIKNVNAGFKLPTHEFLATKTAKRLLQYSIVAGDIIMTRKGTVGNCAFYPLGFPFGIMHSDLLRLRVSFSKCAPLFLIHQLHFSRDVDRQLSLISGGAIMPGINVTKLKTLEVLAPPILLQNEFSDRVEDIEQLKNTHSEFLTELDTLFASLQHRAFRGEL